MAIPTCDDAPLLARALRSVLDQDPGAAEMEILVVDDRSVDADVVALVRELAGDRVTVVVHPTRLGAAGNFTECVRRSSGRWVHVLHADDLVLPGFYAAYTAALDAHPDAVMAVSRSWFVDADEQQLGLSGPLPDVDGLLVDAERLLALDNPVNFVAVVVARDAYEAVGGFDPGLPHANDWEQWTRLAASGPVAVVEGEWAGYRRHDGSDTNRHQRSMTYLTDPLAAIDIITARFASPAEGADVRRQVRRRLGGHALAVARDQAEAGHHRLAATSALWAVRLAPSAPTARASAATIAGAIRRRLGR